MVRIVKIGANHTSTKFKLPLFAKTHCQLRVCPFQKVRTLSNKTVVALTVEPNKAHEPFSLLSGNLINCQNIEVVKLLIRQKFNPERAFKGRTNYWSQSGSKNFLYSGTFVIWRHSRTVKSQI